MGQVHARPAEGRQLRAFEERLFADLRALEKLIEDGRIEEDVHRVGAEQEMFLIGPGRRPAPAALEVLEELDDPMFTSEIALFNLEANLPPLPLSGPLLSRMESGLEDAMTRVSAAAHRRGVDVCLTGILPTLRISDMLLSNMTPLPRYRALNDALLRARQGEPYSLHMSGVDDLRIRHDNVMLEGCNASFQVHLQVGAAEFARVFNLAQLVAGPVLACSTNSPLLFGRRLWRETRIALFQQSIDTRGSRTDMRQFTGRGSFGRDWLRGGIIELYRDNISRHPVLLDVGLAEETDGDAPRLSALQLHNGTVWSWNRPCYGVTDGKPHLRIESRYLPSGPSIPDEVANAAIWLGMMSSFSAEKIEPAQHLPFADCAENFISAGRLGLKAEMTWLDGQHRRVLDLLRDDLLPRARDGLAIKGVDSGDIDRYVGIVEERVNTGRTGARWMLDSFQALERQASTSERLSAITGSARRYQGDGLPVARWRPADLKDAGGWKVHYLRVEQFMTTDIRTVRPDESVRRVASLMDWNRIRHVPVEEDDHLVGLVSYRKIIRLVAERKLEEDSLIPVREVMTGDVVTIPPTTLSVEAIRIMNERGFSALPVVDDGRLVGIVTEHDFMMIARGLLTEKLAT